MASSFREFKRSIAIVSSDMVITEPAAAALAASGLDGGISVLDSRIFVHCYRSTSDGRLMQDSGDVDQPRAGGRAGGDRAGADLCQMVRLDKTRGYKSVLIVPKNSPVRTVSDSLAQPGLYRLRLGAKNSTSGYLAPYCYVFQKRVPEEARIDPVKPFKTVTYGTHRENFLAVAGGRADLGTNKPRICPASRQNCPTSTSRSRSSGSRR